MVSTPQKSQDKNIEAIYPLSPMQEGMLFHTLYAPESGVYFEQFTYEITGNLNIKAFHQAWQKLVDRHPILRTLFVWKNRQQPLQVVRKRAELPWVVEDWRSLSAPQQQDKLTEFLKSDRKEGFECHQAPLMRCKLIQVADQTYYFIWSNHHILLDGWCLPLLVGEVLAFYEALSRGQTLSLSTPRPYRDYISWLQKQDLQKGETFWREQLNGFVTPTPLVVDRILSSAPFPSNFCEEVSLQLSVLVTAQLQALAKQHRLTLNTIVQGAWALLLSRYSGESDVVFGATVSGRPPELTGVESMIGLFINTLPVRVKIPEDGKLIPWLQTLRARQVEIEQYAYSPLVEIQRWSDIPSGTPLFNSILVFENYPVAPSSTPVTNLKIERVSGFEQTNYPLTISAVLLEDNLLLNISYQTSQFEEATVQRMLGNWQTLLVGMVQNPDTHLKTLPLLTEAERHQILIEWNDTATEYPKDKCIHQLFEEQVERTPDAVAVVFEDEQLTYRELNARANQLAHYLKTLGVGPEVLVGICLKRSREMIVGVLGILKTGGAYAPLDPNWPMDRIQRILSTQEVRYLVTESSLLPTLQQIQGQQPQLTSLICLDVNAPLELADNLSTSVTASNLAYIIYTSGSTGIPKGVMVRHQPVVNLIDWVNKTFLVGVRDRLLFVTSLCFDLSVYDIFGILAAGGSIHVASESDLQNPAQLVRILCQQSITFWDSAPAALQQLVPFFESATFNHSHLRLVFFSGDWIPLSLPDSIRKAFPGTQIVSLGGATEAAIWSNYYPIGNVETHWVSIPYGKPIQNAQYYILDPYLNPCPIGITGSLYIGGQCLASGYASDPEKTAQKFIHNPFIDSLDSRMYETGDLARYLPDGNIEFMGRSDNQVKIRGFRIELGEIEVALSKHPDIRETVVIVREDQPGNKRLVAYLVLNLIPERLHYVKPCQLESNGRIYPMQSENFSLGGLGLAQIPLELSVNEYEAVRLQIQLPGEEIPTWLLGKVTWYHDKHAAIEWSLTAEEKEQIKQSYQWLKEELGIIATLQRSLSQGLREYLQGKLPDYMIPSSFVLLENLPLTPNGKIDRKALPAPDWSQRTTADEFVAPQTFTQQILASIWENVLNIESVSITDNFFELGGHSLLAIQVISRIREAFSLNLPIRSLFEHPTLEELAQQIETSQKVDITPIVPVSRGENLPLSFAQQRLWFLDQLEGANATYNMPGALCLEGILNQEALEKSLNQMIQRHESLRTRFSAVNGEAIQIIDPQGEIELEIINLETLEEPDKTIQTQTLMEQEGQKSFNLSQDRLIRASLIKLGTESHILLITMHHIISDGWSLGVFVQELKTLYSGYVQGREVQLAPLPIQYADYAVWQREWLAGENLQKQLDYWKQKLSELPPLLELPTDKPRPPIQTFKGSHISFTLSLELSQKLQQLSQQLGVTLFMTLLSAFSILLSRYSRQEDIAIGSPIANRNRQEIEPLIGFFVNTLVMRVNLEDNPTVEELLKQVRKTCLEAYSHQDVPFEKLVEELKPERNMSHTPLFQVMFILQNAPMEVLSLSGLTLSPVEIDNGISKFDLTVSMEETQSGLKGIWEYNTDLFEKATIERMIGNFQILLEGMPTNPKEKVSCIPLLTEEEKQKILVEWNDTETDYPKEKCIHQLFEEQVERTPDAVAVVYEEKQLTYRELNQKANQLAHYLLKLGVKPDTLVGICVERSLEMIVGLLGILKAGGAYVPIDPNYPKDRIEYMLEDSAISVLLTQENFQGLLSEFSSQLICVERDQQKWQEQSKTNPINQTHASHLAYINYTSGSTGQPKGVMIPHRGVIRLLIKPNYVELDADKTLLHLSPIAFDASTFEIWGALLHGGKCVLFPEKIPTALALKRAIENHKVTTLWLTSALFNSVIDELPDTLVKIKQLLTGGEALSVTHINKALQVLPSTQLIDGYGPTESTTFTCCYPIPQSLKPDISFIPIGKPITSTQVYILDSHLQPLPIGGLGELHIAGDGLARGYLNRPELTTEKFIPNPFDSTRQSQLYKTGDLCRYLPDGNIQFLGRIDHQVKIRGFRIELGEIESLLSAHSDIRETVVIVREDSPENKRLVAYLVSNLIPDRLHYVKHCQLESNGRIYPVQSQDFSLGGLGLSQIPLELSVNEHDTVRLQMQLPGEETPTWLLGKVTWYHDKHAAIEWSLTAQEKEKIKQSYEWLKQELGIIDSLQRSLSQGLREYLKEKLPDYMIPSAFVLLEKLPLTPNSKIDRKALPTPDWSHRTAADNFVAPESETETTLAHIWQEVLKIEKVGINDNFFELGGHSLLATQVISWIREEFSLEIPLHLLFECSTIAQLAESIERSRLTTEIQDSKNSSFDESDREEVEI